MTLKSFRNFTKSIVDDPSPGALDLPRRPHNDNRRLRFIEDHVNNFKSKYRDLPNHQGYASHAYFEHGASIDRSGIIADNVKALEPRNKDEAQAMHAYHHDRAKQLNGWTALSLCTDSGHSHSAAERVRFIDWHRKRADRMFKLMNTMKD